MTCTMTTGTRVTAWRWGWFVAASVAAILFLTSAPLAQAQAQEPGSPGQARVAQNDVRAGQTAGAPSVSDSAAGPTNSVGFALLFWLFSAMVLGGSIFVITRSNLITAVMGMVGTFFAIAVVYAMLYAHFLAAIQVLVYAGAIMVLFVFVIMILNKPETEPWSASGLAGKIVVGAALLYLLYRLIPVLWSINPLPDSLPSPGPVVDGSDWGSTRAVGAVLFREYLFPFEAVSLVLLIAVVGAVAVARPHEPPPATISEGPGNAQSGATTES